MAVAVATKKASTAAFGKFRKRYGPAWGPRIVGHASELDQMGAEDGLEEFVDGPGEKRRLPLQIAPLDPASLPTPRRLWVVRSADVVHAEEECAFGSARSAGKIKHTNLTGGAPAFAGGELVALDGVTLVVSGDSGRYGPRNADEMHHVALAFKESGYAVYSPGYDEEANRAFPLIGVTPRLI